MKYVHVVKFLPLSLVHGPSSTPLLDLDRALSRLNEVIDKAFNELLMKLDVMGVKEVVTSGLAISSVTLGNVQGLVIVAWALVKT